MPFDKRGINGMTVQFGLDTFGDVTAADGVRVHPARVIRDVVAEGVAAEAAGADFFGIGEHHRDDFAISSPEMVLAAIAAKTTRIRLGSAVTVLSSDEPVRVFQRFSTLDAVSSGRAEVILGRGSFTESFPLFGLPLDQYERLFDEKLDLFAKLRAGGAVTWRGTVRAALNQQMVHPPVESGALTTWIGVGGSPQSVVRAAHYRLPMLLAIIGGDPARFRPYVDLYARACAERGQPVPPPVGAHSPGFVGENDAQAREIFWPSYKIMHDWIGAGRGWPPLERAAFDQEIAHGSLYVGGPETVARKIAATVRTLGLARFQLKYSAGPLDHATMIGGIERYGRQVVPMVRDLLNKGETA